jgi:cytochrome c
MVRVAPALAALCTAAMALGGCEPAAPPASAVAPVAAQALPAGGVPNAQLGFDYGAIKTAAEYLAEPPFAAANLARGELLSFACAACHTFGAGERVILGPNLHGVFGRSAAALAQFNYSPALRASGIVWTPRALEAWLAEPARFVEGTTMAFSGYRSAEDRRDLIAYLLQATQ